MMNVFLRRGMLCLLISYTSVSSINSQNNIPDNYFLEILQEQEGYTTPPELSNITTDGILKLMAIIKHHQKDSIFEKRWQGVQIVTQTGAIATDNRVKQTVTSLLLSYLYDTDSRIVSMAALGLKTANRVTYNSGQQDTILQLLDIISNRSILTELYIICGTQQISQSATLLFTVAGDRNYPFMQRWVALSALTRLGYGDAEQEMFSYLNRIPLNLNAIDGLFPYIMYSQSRKNAGYLIERILYDDTSECESSNPNYTKTIPCAYMLLRTVAPGIRELKWEDELQDLPYTEALERARKKLKVLNNNWSFEENYTI